MSGKAKKDGITNEHIMYKLRQHQLMEKERKLRTWFHTHIGY